jgi:hypothetical protein
MGFALILAGGTVAVTLIVAQALTGLVPSSVSTTAATPTRTTGADAARTRAAGRVAGFRGRALHGRRAAPATSRTQ